MSIRNNQIPYLEFLNVRRGSSDHKRMEKEISENISKNRGGSVCVSRGKVRTYMAFSMHYRGIHETEPVECKKLFLKMRYVYLKKIRKK